MRPGNPFPGRISGTHRNYTQAVDKDARKTVMKATRESGAVMIHAPSGLGELVRHDRVREHPTGLRQHRFVVTEPEGSPGVMMPWRNVSSQPFGPVSSRTIRTGA